MSTIVKPARILPKSLSGDIDKPSLHALSYALRHPDTWPEGFVWNYSECKQCAMGLAYALWQSSIPEPSYRCHTGSSRMARAFAMPYSKAEQIFFAAGNWSPTEEKTQGALWWKTTETFADFDAITPEMVADQIDAYLATAE